MSVLAIDCLTRKLGTAAVVPTSRRHPAAALDALGSSAL